MQKELNHIIERLDRIKSEVEELRSTCQSQMSSKEEHQVVRRVLEITTDEINQIVGVLGRTSDELDS